MVGKNPVTKNSAIKANDMPIKIGLLALQGDFEKHKQQIETNGAETILVKLPQHLKDIDGLIVPGGESTSILKLLESDFGEPGSRTLKSQLSSFNRPILATCAGLILVANKVINPEQESLKLLDITVARNAYGRQINSFIDNVELSKEGKDLFEEQDFLEGVFIRAPQITSLGEEVEIIASYKEDPVMVRQGHVFGMSFHPELANGKSFVHDFFTNYCRTVASQRP